MGQPYSIYYEESLVSSNLNSNLLWFHCAHPNHIQLPKVCKHPSFHLKLHCKHQFVWIKQVWYQFWIMFDLWINFLSFNMRKFCPLLQLLYLMLTACLARCKHSVARLFHLCFFASGFETICAIHRSLTLNHLPIFLIMFMDWVNIKFQRILQVLFIVDTNSESVSICTNMRFD